MIIWDKKKNERLKQERDISFEEIKCIVEAEAYLDFIENPARIGQFIFIIRLRGYVYSVPFIFDKDDNIILKTAYPNRKFNKQYHKHI